MWNFLCFDSVPVGSVDGGGFMISGTPHRGIIICCVVLESSDIQTIKFLVCFECKLQVIIKITGGESGITWVVPKLLEVFFEIKKPFRSLALLNSLQLLKEAAKRLLMLGFQSSSPTPTGAWVDW
uniref:Uncharacterized protein n=1 Tax=Salix viminalis TaxID=40686 RepID=A0A6N2MKV8_SALVM